MGMVRFWILLSFVTLSFLVVGCQERTRETNLPISVRDTQVQPPVQKPAPEIISTQAAFIEVSRTVTPAVVNISATKVSRGSEQLSPFFDDFFGEFFRGPPRPPRKEQSLGSGFLISADGYILTNEHVVKGGEQITVKLSDQRTFAARVIGIDPRTDVAVLKIDAREELPTVVLGDSDALQVGQWALAIGNPFGLDRTLTVGVISATGRANLGIEDYEDFIQTDASINPGNSGGPLLNIYGEVVGINTAIVAAGQGIGFAIPINLARLIAQQLMETGQVTRGWLGVSIQPLTRELAESFGLDTLAGALINQVLPGSPAEAAGVRRGDILVAFDGREVRGVRELQLMVASTPVGKTVQLEVLRGGKRQKLPVTIVAQDQPATAGAPPATTRDKESALGLTVVPAEDGEGVLVEEVDPGGQAAAAGVRPGDQILAINKDEVRDLASFHSAVRKAQTGKHIVLLLRRGDATLYLAFPVS
jgi:Do/DeqQ family serine protease